MSDWKDPTRLSSTVSMVGDDYGYRIRWLLRFMRDRFDYQMPEGFTFPDGNTWYPLGDDE
jgi:hypothetical protein